jgi:hypothetical protein
MKARKSPCRITSVWLVVSALGLAAASWVTESSVSSGKIQVLKSYGELPLSFEANQGQIDERVKFLSRGKGYTLFLTAEQAVLVLRKEEKRPISNRQQERARARSEDKVTQSILKMRLVGANPDPNIAGLDELSGKSNYFIGKDPKRWRTNIPAYRKIKYGELYPGVDLVYYGNHQQLEYDFIVAPGADPDRITLAFEGADGLEVDAHGDLVAHVAGGHIRMRKPMVYQELDSIRQQISGGYVLKGNNQVGFHAASYEASKPLIIDPVLVYSTYLGGSENDQSLSIAVDREGNAYVAGHTESLDFPTANPLQSAPQTRPDAFVAKLAPLGADLVYSTYLGASSSDGALGIAVDSSGNAYVTGWTLSPDFPIVNAVQSAFRGGACFEGSVIAPPCGDAFVAKLDTMGSALVYSTFLGGSRDDVGSSIAVDSSANAYVTGWTLSTDFPIVAAFWSALGGSRDSFVVKLDSTGSSLVYSTYLGGSNSDSGGGIAVNSGGSASVTGWTDSIDFPLVNALQPTFGGGRDAFVAKFDPIGAPLFSTYLGGANSDSGSGIAVDSEGNLYLTGRTRSNDFPTVNALQPVNGGPSLFGSTNGGADWSGRGLNNLGTSALVIDLANPSVIYAGTQGSGVFKSIDGGMNWTAINIGITTFTVNALAIDPTIPSIIYAGTAKGAFKSIDGGMSWMSTGLSDPFVSALAIDPALPLVIYAGTIGNGVFKSLDGGLTWISSNIGLSDPWVSSLAIDPGTPNVLYAGTGSLAVFKSVNGALTWLRTPRWTECIVSSLAIEPTNSLILYGGSRCEGVFKSTDGGATWRARNTGLRLLWINALAIDPTNPLILYAGTMHGGIFKSINGGETWTAINTGLNNPAVLSIAIGSTNPLALYAGIQGHNFDAFVTKIDAAGSRRIYSTYLGGSLHEEGIGIAVDGSGSAYLTGFTMSLDYPITTNASQPSFSGNLDAFVTKLDPTGSVLVYSTYFGGSGVERGFGIAVDATGNAYATGTTSSVNFPTADALQPVFAGGLADGFVVKITEGLQ